jgi:hypothetical protein
MRRSFPRSGAALPIKPPSLSADSVRAPSACTWLQESWRRGPQTRPRAVGSSGGSSGGRRRRQGHQPPAMPTADYEAVCAQLSTPELGAVAQSENIVWGQLKGYPYWPVSLHCSRAARGPCSAAACSHFAGQAGAPLATGPCCSALHGSDQAAALMSLLPLHRCAGPGHGPQRGCTGRAAAELQEGQRAQSGAVFWRHEQELVGAPGCVCHGFLRSLPRPQAP